MIQQKHYAKPSAGTTPVSYTHLSNIRKYLFDNDWVEAIIQMPSDEFFNTGIVTYLWILNKNKPAERKDKVILINAADLWQPLKKNKGSKRKEMNPEHRAACLLYTSCHR